MITPVPTQVADPKDAVMWSVLNALEQIDNNTSSRGTFAQSILFNIATQLDGPIFKEEIRQLREQLGVKEAPPEPVIERPPQEYRDEINREDLIMREL